MEFTQDWFFYFHFNYQTIIRIVLLIFKIVIYFAKDRKPKNNSNKKKQISSKCPVPINFIKTVNEFNSTES